MLKNKVRQYRWCGGSNIIHLDFGGEEERNVTSANSNTENNTQKVAQAQEFQQAHDVLSRDARGPCTYITLDSDVHQDIEPTINTLMVCCIFVWLSPPGPCGVQRCFNNGTCAENGDRFTCQCPSGFYGEHCQIGKVTTVSVHLPSCLLTAGAPGCRLSGSQILTHTNNPPPPPKKKICTISRALQ